MIQIALIRRPIVEIEHGSSAMRAVAVPNGAVGLLSPPPPPSDLVAAASSSLLLHCSSCPRLSKECRPQIQFESFSSLIAEI